MVALWRFESPSYRIKSSLLQTRNNASFIYCLFKPFLIVWLWRYCTFSDGSVVRLKYSPWPKYIKYGTIFQKHHVLISTFFSSSNMFFIRLFLANTWKKKIGVTLLVSSQTAVISGHGFEIAVRMETKTLKFILGKNTTNTKEWDKSRFDENLELKSLFWTIL